MKLKRLLTLSSEEQATLTRVGVVALAIFAILLVLVLTGIINPLDQYLETNLFREEKWTDQLLKVTESPGQRRFVYPTAILLSLVFTFRRKDLLPTITAVSALLFTNAVTGVFKILTLRGFPRTEGPEAWNTHLGSINDIASNLGAFPSGHATNVAAGSTLMVMAAYSARPKYRPYATHITVITGIFSVIVMLSSWLRNTHWLTDLVAGLALGVATTVAATLWALRLPDYWRHPELAGHPRLAIGGVAVGTLAFIFMFAGNSFLSHSGTSVVMVGFVLFAIAHQSHKGIKRAVARRQNEDSTT